MASFVFMQDVGRFGLALLAFSAACSEPLLLVLDSAHCGFFLPLRGLAHSGFSSPLFGRAALGFALLVLGFSNLDLFLSLRSIS